MVNILILLFKDPFYYANGEIERLCLRERAAGELMHLFQPSAPTSASTGCQARDLVRRVSEWGCGGSLSFDSHFLCDLLVLPYNFSPSSSQHANSSCIMALPLLPRGQAASLETVTLHPSQLLREKCWSNTDSTAKIFLRGIWRNTLCMAFFKLIFGNFFFWGGGLFIIENFQTYTKIERIL